MPLNKEDLNSTISILVEDDVGIDMPLNKNKKTYSTITVLLEGRLTHEGWYVTKQINL